MSEFKKQVTVTYSKLPKWESLTNAQYAARFRREVREQEQAFRTARERGGKRVAGPEKLSRLDYRDRPKTPRRRTRQPMCHASTPEAAADYKVSWRSFLDERLKASERFLKGNLYVEFPKGSFPPPLITLARFSPPPST